MGTHDDIIKRIIGLIEENRKTKTSFSKLAGLDPASFGRMLKGELTITDRTIHKICDTYGVNFNWLLSGEGDKYSPNILNQNNNQGDNLTDSIKIEQSSELIKLLKKRDEQIDRLLSIIEQMSKDTI